MSYLALARWALHDELNEKDEQTPSPPVRDSSSCSFNSSPRCLVHVALDRNGYPYRPCPACGSRSFWKPADLLDAGPGGVRRPRAAQRRVSRLWSAARHGPGWPTSVKWGRSGRRGSQSRSDCRTLGLGNAPWRSTAVDDDREWLRLWRTAGPALTDRLPVVRAWIAAAPPQPLPRRLAAVELRRIARQHGLMVELAPQDAGRRGDSA